MLSGGQILPLGRPASTKFAMLPAAPSEALQHNAPNFPRHALISIASLLPPPKCQSYLDSAKSLTTDIG